MTISLSFVRSRCTMAMLLEAGGWHDEKVVNTVATQLSLINLRSHDFKQATGKSNKSTIYHIIIIIEHSL